VADVVANLVAGGGVDLILVGRDKYYERSTIDRRSEGSRT